MREFTVYLSERFLAAHRKHRMAKANEDTHKTDEAGCVVDELEVIAQTYKPFQTRKPSQCIFGFRRKIQVRRQRCWRKLSALEKEGQAAPRNHDHNHRGCDVHDLHRIIAGFVNSLQIPPPEINCGENGYYRCKLI